MNMYLQSDKEISFVLQKIPYKKLWNLIELGVVHQLHHTDILTLIGMRGDTFISLSFLDQILPAEFLSKISKLFWR